MRRARLLDRNLSSNITDNKYMDINSDGNSYGTEPTIFNSNANSTAKSENACEASA